MPTRGGPELIHFDVATFVQDEKAYKQMWLCIGAGGLRPCCLCRNILMEGTDVSGDDYFRTPSSAAAADFHLHTAESIQDCIDQVASLYIGPRPPSKGRVEEAYKIHGWKYDEHGILDDPYVLQFFTLRVSPPAHPNTVARRVALIRSERRQCKQNIEKEET